MLNTDHKQCDRGRRRAHGIANFIQLRPERTGNDAMMGIQCPFAELLRLYDCNKLSSLQ